MILRLLQERSVRLVAARQRIFPAARRAFSSAIVSFSAFSVSSAVRRRAVRASAFQGQSVQGPHGPLDSTEHSVGEPDSIDNDLDRSEVAAPVA